MTLSPLAEITPNRFDEPILGAVTYLRAALLNEPDVIDHVLALADLRGKRRESPQAGLRYWLALDATLLLEQFTRSEVDTMASTIREQLAAKVWGGLIPVGRGAGYGRTKSRARAMTPDTIELAVADFVHRLSGRKAPHLDKIVTLPATLRKARQRARLLSQL